MKSNYLAQEATRSEEAIDTMLAEAKSERKHQMIVAGSCLLGAILLTVAFITGGTLSLRILYANGATYCLYTFATIALKLIKTR